MENKDFFDQIWLNRFQIFVTKDGFMAFDHDCDEYLYDDNGDNCFDGYSYAMDLVNDAIATVQEHKEF
jgi:hypothetical protein